MKGTIAILLAILPLLAGAQKMKYKDLFPIIVSATQDEAQNNLQRFVLSEPDHPNANLRLAMIYEQNYLNADALTEHKKVLAYAERAKLRYLKSRMLINEKEVSRNEDYYAFFATTFDKKGRPEVAYAPIRQKMDNGYDSAELILKKLPPIYTYFTKAVNSYGEAHRHFLSVNDTYKSTDDLFMLFDENLKNKLILIKASMDSSIANFNKYKVLIEEYPINNYNQSIELVPITYYRLDGLAEMSNFLQNKIRLWNYSEWVDDILKTSSNEISEIRKNLAAYDTKLNDNLKTLQNDPDAETVLEPDRELIYNIRKYDYESLAITLLDYKNFKQQLLKKEKLKSFYDTASHEKMLSKYNFYSELIKQYALSDSLLSLVKNNNIPSKQIKYKSFIDDHYQGTAGLSIYINNEKELIDRNYNIYQLVIRNDLLDELNKAKEVPARWVKFNRLEIPLFLNSEDSASMAGNKVITTSIDYRADSSRYVAGFRPVDNGNRNIAYLAQVDAMKKVVWLKEFDISIDSGVVDASSLVTDLEITRDGCAVMISSTHLESGGLVNTFIYLDDQGAEKINTRLETELYPRKILYDQDGSRFILVMRGEFPQQQILRDEPMQIVSYNTLGDKLWEREFDFSGSFETIININNGYIIGGNYSSLKVKDGKVYRTRGQLNETNAFLLKLSSQGDIQAVKPFEESKPYYIVSSYKINDGNINFFGFGGSYGSDKGDLHSTNDNIKHLMVDENLNRIELEK